ncbi:unnamed protein product (macronuclear) [Paramecium tetraurelia]|uniref:Uncharacterized protein n=1 Tax=Paramecium tetraurelia TaxID=5888 RepID=A0CC33_PARTE|nr:uncharacterized protein GSPATT00037134001 [Paramecium tetraurelia]CAK68350.1 unnamed protein product [Paramecium tetraurelia]|eukprot:XP_001435747.1 hypothetical protein (macronuclear) [Paramecium tetraurelia strain d4-2]
MNTRSENLDNAKSLFQEHLPRFFAENILYLEMEVECNNVTIEVVNQLLELYRIGVEYFESIKSNKFLVFKNKTQQLLMRGNVNQCMNVAYEELKHETALKKSRLVQSHDILPPTSPKVIIPQKSQKQQELENQFKYIQEQDQKLQVNQLLEFHGYEQQRVTRMHNKALQEQEDQVQMRLQRQRQQSVRLKGQNE